MGRLLNTKSTQELQKCIEIEEELSTALSLIGIRYEHLLICCFLVSGDYCVRSHCAMLALFRSVHPCKNSMHGCQWYGPHEHTHELECLFRRVPCKNGACGMMVFVKDWEWHLEHDCRQRHTNCDKCGLVVVFDDLEHHLASDCSHLPVRCVHGCDLVLIREMMKHHEETECELRPVVCEVITFF